MNKRYSGLAAIACTLVMITVTGCSSEEGPSIPSMAPTSTVSVSGSDLILPTVAWEGGPEYWAKFPNASDWTDPSFLPIGIWFNGISTDEEVQWDKDHGINLYVGMWEGTDFGLWERNDVYWVGGKLNNTFKESSKKWPGIFLDDEVDGRFTPAQGLKLLQGMRDAASSSGKFTYANFTQMTIDQDNGISQSAQQDYVNLPDVVSLDQYWYTIPFCDWTPYRGEQYIYPIAESACRTASSYGKATNGLTFRDASDGTLHPRWMFVENLNGSGDTYVRNIAPDQVKGAAMNSIINEARGLMWFNQSLTGPCQTSKALRDAQILGTEFCGYDQIQAMGEVNNLIRSLAPVINTQSYQWTFGNGLDTMLKIYDGYAYIFAMTDGTTGNRTLDLPPGITGKTAEIIGENRTITNTNNQLTDNFASESTYHIYKIESV